jgi:hypothetical protein
VEGGPVVWDRWGMKRIVVLALMAGCATSYQSATSHQAIGGGAYLITASGNGWTGSSTVEQYKYRRATELCPGGFDVIDANQSMRTSVTTFDSGKTYQTINRPSGSLAIRCKQAPAANAGAGGFWCSTRAELGICYVQPGDCEVRRREATANYCGEKSADECEPFAPCTFSAVAICAPSGCYTSPAACADRERTAGRDGRACVVRQ